MSIWPLHFEIDNVDRNSWDHLITQFDDASLYQTWSWGALAGRGSSLSHVVIKAGEEILGCCQVTIRQLPFLKIGVADVSWGPLCMKRGGTFKPDVLFHLVRGIKEEYGIKRGYLLRVWPHAIGERKDLLNQTIETEGFKRNPLQRPYRTFMLDLSPSLDDIRKNFLQKWRNCLNKAEKNELRVVDGTSDDFYKIFIMLGKEMVERKDLTRTHIGIFEKYRRIQEDLPEPLKMKIMICEANGEPVCATISVAIGNTGIYILGATGQKGLKLNGSYLLQWRMIQWMREKGVRYYDLGAFNPQLNPGVYHFKRGIAGKKGWEETFLGEYYGCFNLSGRVGRPLLECYRLLSGIFRRG